MKFEFGNLDGAIPETICRAFKYLLHKEKSVVLTYDLFDVSLYEWIIGNNIWKKIRETDHIYSYPLNNNGTQFMDIDIAYIDSDIPNVITLKMKDNNTMKKQLNSIFGLDSITRYCDSDVTATRIAYNNMYKNTQISLIKNVIFNDPATIVFWNDGTKTVVKAENEEFDPEKGLAMAISKKVLGNKGNYYETFKKWLPKEDKNDNKLEEEYDNTEILTAKQLAEKIGSSVSTVLRDCRRGLYPGAVKVDGKWLIPFEGLKKEDKNE